MHDNRPFRVGLVGCGNITVGFHAPVLRDLPGVEVAAVADPTVSRRAEALELLGLPEPAGFPDLQAMLASADLDYVVLAAPPALRRPMIEACAAAGVHVLTEKPLDTRPAQARMSVEAMDRAGLRLGMVHNYLYYPEYRALRQLLEEGRLGAFRHLDLAFLGVPDLPGHADYRPRWRHDPAQAGGGVLMDMIHVLYIAEFIAGQQAEAVTALADNLDLPGEPVEDLITVLLHFPRGHATVHLGWGKGPGGAQLAGTEGRAVLLYRDLGTGPFSEVETLQVVDGQGRREVRLDRQDAVRRAFVALHQDFVDALRQGRPPAADGAAGLHALELAMAAYASAARGRAVPLPLDPEDPVYQEGAAGLRQGPRWPGSPLVRRGLFDIPIPPETEA